MTCSLATNPRYHPSTPTPYPLGALQELSQLRGGGIHRLLRGRAAGHGVGEVAADDLDQLRLLGHRRQALTLGNHRPRVWQPGVLGQNFLVLIRSLLRRQTPSQSTSPGDVRRLDPAHELPTGIRIRGTDGDAPTPGATQPSAAWHDGCLVLSTHHCLFVAIDCGQHPHVADRAEGATLAVDRDRVVVVCTGRTRLCGMVYTVDVELYCSDTSLVIDRRRSDIGVVIVTTGAIEEVAELHDDWVDLLRRHRRTVELITLPLRNCLG